MTRLVLAVAMAVALAAPVRAQENAVEAVIGAQIEAFQRDDFATAFGYASPLIKDLFGSPERFGAMVRQGYPMVWRPAEVQYLGQRTEGGFTYQRVRIRDPQGAYFTLEYQMLATPDGWQINGVRFVAPADAAA